MTDEARIERDLLGEVAVPAGSLHGVHTERALENFPLAGRPGARGARPRVRRRQARLRAHQPRARRLGRRRRQGRRHRARLPRAGRRRARRHIVVDRLQGGAGTSTNMNVNEVLANRALQLLGAARRRLRPRLAARRRQPAPEHQRHLPHRAAPRGHHAAAPARGAGRRAAGGVPGRRSSEFAHVVKVGRTE